MAVCTKVTLNGRVRGADAKNMLAKQLQGLGSAPDFMNLTTGVIRSKKAKKEKTPEEEEAMFEMKKMHKKYFA